MVHLVKKCKLMSGSRRRWANNPCNYLYHHANMKWSTTSQCTRFDLCNCKIEFVIFFSFIFENILFMRFSMRKDSWLELWLFFSQVFASLTIFVHKSLIIFKGNIPIPLISFSSLSPFLSLCIQCCVASARTNTSYFVWYSVNNIYISCSAFHEIDVNYMQDKVHQMQYSWCIQGAVIGKRQTKTLTNSKHLMDAPYD